MRYRGAELYVCTLFLKKSHFVSVLLTCGARINGKVVTHGLPETCPLLRARKEEFPSR
jgi:hypothetical protein